MARWQRMGVPFGRGRGQSGASARFGGAGGWRTRGEISGVSQIVDFSIQMDDVEVMHALASLEREMPEKIMEVLEQSMNEVRNSITDHLLSMSSEADDAQMTIAESIDVLNTGTSIRIFSQPYPGGVLGSRGVSLAQLYIQGSPPYMYGFDIMGNPGSKPKIPSSKAWLRTTGNKFDAFDPIKNPIHPGFGDWHPNSRKTYDWVKEAEEYIMDNFEHDLKTMIDNAYGGGGHY